MLSVQQCDTIINDNKIDIKRHLNQFKIKIRLAYSDYSTIYSQFKEKHNHSTIMDSARTTKKLEMLQDYPMKYKKLKHNLSQSQNLNKQLKSQLLKLGSQCNSVLIFVTKMSSQITALKSQLLKGEKQLSSVKQELRRIAYKTQKVEIKHKQYTQRVRRFQQMHNMKQSKNLALEDKILRIEQKLTEQRLKEQQLVMELSAVQKTRGRVSNKENIQRECVSVKSRRGSVVDVGVNSCYEGEVSLVRNEGVVKRLRQEKEEAERRNGVVKSSINKIQLQISQLNDFLSQNTSIPHFRQSHQSLPLTTPSNPPLLTSISNTRLPSHLSSSLSSFQSIKSKSILQDLVQKHEQVTQYQDVYVKCLEESYRLITELSEVNKVIGAGMMEENAKIAAFAIRGKMYTDKRRKSVA